VALARGVNGPRDEFLARAGLAEHEDGRVGGGNGGDLLQDPLQRRALGHDLSEVLHVADLLVKVDVLVGEAVLQCGNLAECQRVLERDRDLRGRLTASVHFVRAERDAGAAMEHEEAQRSTRRRQRDETRPLHARRLLRPLMHRRLILD